MNNTAITGGAVSLQPGITTELRNLRFVGNTALRGVIHVGFGTRLFVSNVVIENSISAAGGALFLESGATADINATEFFNNSAMTGGAAYMSESTALACYDSKFESNHANSGGAVASFGSEIVLKDCDFLANAAREEGGAVFLAATAFVSGGGCTYSRNIASSGAIAYVKAGSTFLLHQTDSGTGNNASFGGGQLSLSQILLRYSAYFRQALHSTTT